ncbi:MAG: response regulator [Planctomycetes bacterium]|nr:response regulator [Planctomycetota bacterium]
MQPDSAGELREESAELAHELNNILAVLRISLSLAQRELASGHPPLESLEEIGRLGGRLEALARRLRVLGGAQPPDRAAAAHSDADTLPPDAHVLLVDDDAALVLLSRRLLERSGLRVSSCSRPEAAVEVVRADPQDFDLIVIDLNLGGRSGFELARELCELRADLPLVLASSYVDEALQARARELGVALLCEKPGTVEEYARLIQGRVRRRGPS